MFGKFLPNGNRMTFILIIMVNKQASTTLVIWSALFCTKRQLSIACYADAWYCNGESVCLSVRPSVRMSHCCIVSKRRKLGSRNIHCQLSEGLPYQGSEADLDMFSTFGQTGAPTKGVHGPENVGQQRDIFWLALYGKLRHSRSSICAARHSLA